MKHRFSFTAVCWWVFLLAALGIFLLVCAPKEERISERENRTMAGAPKLTAETLVSGDFTQGVEDWLSDGFFARNKVVSFTETLLAMTSFEETKEVDVEARLEEEMPEPETEDETEEEEPAAKTSEIIPEIPMEKTEEEAQYPSEPLTLWLDKTDGTREVIYKYSDKNVATVSNMLNAYRDALGEDGTVHYMQIPFSATAYRWTANTKTYCGWGCNVEDAIRTQTKDGVYVHNVPEMMEEELRVGEYLYYRLDHHWTPRGACLVVGKIMESQGYPAIAYDEYRYSVYKNFYGSQYDASQPEKMRKMVDTLDRMYPLLPAKHYLVSKLTTMKESALINYTRTSYTAYMNGTQGPWRYIDTGYSTGRTALVICDSFGTTFAPYLMPYYDGILMTDLRPDYYNEAKAGATVREYIEQYCVDDIYMVMSTVSGPNRQYSQKYILQYLD